MSASLLVATPPALLALVFLLCFVGCDRVFGLEPIPENPPFTKYTPSILDEPTLVAYWPLGEPPGAPTAVDLKGNRNGTYLAQALPDDPAIGSAGAPGTLVLGQPGIVAGDTAAPFDDPNARTTCIEVNGGYVSVPYDPALNPAKVDGFTLEAWVRVGWSGDSTAANRTIMTALDQVTGLRGFWLYAGGDNIWKALIGTGPGPTFVNGPDVLLDTTNHIVLTYDGTFVRTLCQRHAKHLGRERLCAQRSEQAVHRGWRPPPSGPALPLGRQHSVRRPVQGRAFARSSGPACR